MKRFRFRLERVMKAKQAIQSVRQVELAGAKARLDSEERVLASLLTSVRESEERYRSEATGGGIVPWKLSWAAGHLKCLDAEAEAQGMNVENHRDQVEICRQRVVEARQDTKALENLKAKRRAEHLASLLKEEQDRLDEVGGVQYAARTRPGTPAGVAG